MRLGGVDKNNPKDVHKVQKTLTCVGMVRLKCSGSQVKQLWVVDNFGREKSLGESLLTIA